MKEIFQAKDLEKECNKDDELAYNVFLIEQLSMPLDDKIHSEYLTKEEFLSRRKQIIE